VLVFLFLISCSFSLIFFLSSSPMSSLASCEQPRRTDSGHFEACLADFMPPGHSRYVLFRIEVTFPLFYLIYFLFYKIFFAVNDCLQLRRDIVFFYCM
jgi:hypothetical protein